MGFQSKTLLVSFVKMSAEWGGFSVHLHVGDVGRGERARVARFETARAAAAAAAAGESTSSSEAVDEEDAEETMRRRSRRMRLRDEVNAGGGRRWGRRS